MSKVEIVGAPGFVDGFKAELVPELEHVMAVDDRGELAVIVTEVGDFHVVPSSCVRPVDSPEGEAYRDEWQAKTGRARSDIYIPEALR